MSAFTYMQLLITRAHVNSFSLTDSFPNKLAVCLSPYLKRASATILPKFVLLPQPILNDFERLLKSVWKVEQSGSWVSN